jgi:hypothetical protein
MRRIQYEHVINAGDEDESAPAVNSYATGMIAGLPGGYDRVTTQIYAHRLAGLLQIRVEAAVTVVHCVSFR